MKRILRVLLIVGAVSGLGLLGLLVWATGNANRLEQHYDTLLWLNGLFALGLFAWVGSLAVKLVRQLRRRQFGARLTARFALAFALIGVIPGVLIYTLSLQFLSRSIESWFNVRVDSALEAGLNLGRAALDSQLADLGARARAMTAELNNLSDDAISPVLTRLRESQGVQEALVFTGSGRIVAFSTNQYGQLLPSAPPATVMNQLRVARGYSAVEADDIHQGSLMLRVVVPLTAGDTDSGNIGSVVEPHWLQLVQPVPELLARNANQVREGFQDYQELGLSRQGLRRLYGITLTLALLWSVLASVAVALSLSKRLARPLLRLAEGTRDIGAGHYRPLPDLPENDELGQLTLAFNAMTRQLDESHQLVERNRQQLERSNTWLESVLANLSSGVLAFDESLRVTMANQGAQAILQCDLRSVHGRPLEVAEGMLEFASLIRQAFASHAAVGSERTYWQQQFEIQIGQSSQRSTLLARGTHLHVDGSDAGYLVVFDDITEVISANRTMAWGEVARRLAHEIKNPLTPIQLYAERLAMKLSGRLAPADAEMLNRATNTIINQVGSLKQMVDDFREYARTPPAVMRAVDFNALVSEVLSLYGWGGDAAQLPAPASTAPALALDVQLEPGLPRVEGDPTQLRQVIHNLLANARDAVAERGAQGQVRVSTQLVNRELGDGGAAAVRFVVADNGPGFAPQVAQRAFEPYITTKAHGTGLGLAIVRKIVDEHGGRIDLANRKEGGARVSILLTRLAPLATAPGDADTQQA